MKPRESTLAPLRVGLIGLGAWGSRLLLALRRLDRARLMAICDLDPGRLARAVATFHEDRASAGPPRALHDPAALCDPALVDAVVIATPPQSHAPLVLAALDRGLHVFVEKPLATTLEEVRAIERRSGAAGRVVMVGHILEHHPAVIALEALIRTGALGEPRALHCRRLGAAPRDEGAWWSLAPHDLGLVHRLVGAPSTIRVVARRGQTDQRVAHVITEGGRRARLEVGYGHSSKVRSVRFIGAAGIALFDDLATTHKLRVRMEAGRWQTIDTEATEPLLLECRRFVAAVLDGVDPITGVRAGADVVRWLVAGDLSLLSGAAVRWSNGSPEPEWSDTSDPPLARASAHVQAIF